MDYIAWVITGGALFGTILNINKDSRCFIVWAVTNSFWSIFDWSIGAYAQSVLFGIYFLLSVYGLWKWRRNNGHS